MTQVCLQEDSVRILGARGSLPVSGRDYLYYGGSTACVLLCLAGETILLDAGTGIRNLPEDVLRLSRISLLLSHCHADHIIGLPMCPYLAQSGGRLDIYAVQRGGLACRAAMDMVKGSATLGEELERQFGRTVDFGIGVHYGPAVVGNIGASRRMDYTAIGDTVNTAARLEANAKGGQILISRAVKEMLGDRARTTSLGDSIHLKGKSSGFEIFTLDELL